MDGLYRILNQFLGYPYRLILFGRQTANNIFSHHRKTLSRGACIVSIYRCVERQNIGLECNAINRRNNFSDLLRRRDNVIHHGVYLFHLRICQSRPRC